MKSIAALIARLAMWRPGPRAIDVVDQRPLFGGAVVYVIDVDGRRYVVASSGGEIRLLARYERPRRDPRTEEAATVRV